MDIQAVPTDGSGAVLEIGCGWGSFLLYSAAKNPTVRFVGFSNSATQRAYISDEAERRGLGNVTVLRLDINDFCDAGSLPAISSDAVGVGTDGAVPSFQPAAVAKAKYSWSKDIAEAAVAAAMVIPDLSQLKFDRIFSCECLEHSRDYRKAFEAMSKVLKDDGKVFLQILCHREYTYFMNNDDWMGRNFFTGGTM
jgi:cyclopropane-fatty-acyl-phospholipid synthase